MKQESFVNKSNLFESVKQEATVLTPNRRIAADLFRDFSENNVKSNGVFNSPNIIPIEAWIVSQWQENSTLNLNRSKKLISKEQEIQIWHQIIQKESTDYLLDINHTAKIASNAYDLIQKWHVPISEILENMSFEHEIFLKWLDMFTKYLDKYDYITGSSLINYLVESIKDNQMDLPKRIIFACFDEFIPSIQSLKDTLNEKLSVQIYENIPVAAKCFLHEAKDTNQELIDMLSWAKSHYQRGTKKIACVITNLAVQKKNLVSMINQYLVDDNEVIPYDISAGNSLYEYPIVSHALNALQLLFSKDIKSYLSLMENPYIKGYSTEQFSRKKLANRLTADGLFNITFQDVINYAKDSESVNHCPQLAKILSNIELVANKDHLPSEWVTLISNYLKIFGWPGDEILSSEEYQAYTKFSQCLSKLIELDSILGAINIEKAWHLIKKYSIDTEFQIESPKTPIQFLGLLEASGREFECIWVTNVHDQTWPEPMKPNPLIPQQVQIKYNLPHSSFERELEFSKNMTARFASSASEVIFSYGKLANDLEYHPSPLVTQFPRLNKIDSQRNKYLSVKDTDFEYYDDDYAPAIGNEFSPKAGSEIIRQQAECPFKAFASFRLNLESPTEQTYGINYMQRGILLHDILENIFKHFKTIEKINNTSEKSIEHTIKTIIDTSIVKNFSASFQSQHRKLFLIEKRRLLQLSLAFIEFEKTRPAFSIHALEHRQQITLSDLKFNLRVDRIDRIEDKFAIIDYKSTAASGIDWFSDRPDTPQLLLYLISSDLDINSIVFAQVKKGEILFRGISYEETDIPGVMVINDIENDENWNLQKKKWKQILEKLVDDFANGHAYINPKYVTTCSRCSYQPLCRIHDKELIND